MELDIETSTPSSLYFWKQPQQVGNYCWWKVYVMSDDGESLHPGDICHLTKEYHDLFLKTSGKTEEGFYFIPKKPNSSDVPLLDPNDLIALAEALIGLNEQVEKNKVPF